MSQKAAWLITYGLLCFAFGAWTKERLLASRERKRACAAAYAPAATVADSVRIARATGCPFTLEHGK